MRVVLCSSHGLENTLHLEERKLGRRIDLERGIQASVKVFQFKNENV